MLYDTHCHLYKEYYDDIDSIIKKAKDNGVEKYISDATNIDTCYEMLELASKYDDVYITLGIHPECIDDSYEELESIINDNLDNPKFVAIGEIGLDYHYEGYDRDKQIELLEKQLTLAEKINKPVVIHCRDAFNDMIELLRKHSNRGVIHCFEGTLDEYKQYEALGYYIGVDGNVTFKNSKTRDVIKDIPMDRILLETDSPYLTPEPYRGIPNDPSYILNIAEYIANLKNIDINDVKLCQKSVVSKVFDF
jgi:TatD DNase family protein